MKLGKAIFVTVLIAAMLAAVNACLYVLFMPGFATLTGVVAAYGFLRGAVDFCNWLQKTDDHPSAAAAAAAAAVAEESDGADTRFDPARAAALMHVLDSEI